MAQAKVTLSQIEGGEKLKEIMAWFQKMKDACSIPRAVARKGEVWPRNRTIDQTRRAYYTICRSLLTVQGAGALLDNPKLYQ